MTAARNLRVMRTIPLLSVVCLCGFPSYAKYSGGSGAVADPYRIATAQDLMTLGESRGDYSKHFVLVSDIDLGNFTGTAFNIIGPAYHDPFRGVFDGNDYTISNFTYTCTDTSRIGLFGSVAESGRIKNLGLVDPNVEAGTSDYVGSLVGENRGTLIGCYVQGAKISGRDHVGALAGSTGPTSYCHAAGSVWGNHNVGGLVGYTWSLISNCYSTAAVSGGDTAGGLVGWNNGTIAGCYSTGSVSGTRNIGGLAGVNDLIVADCLSTCDVSGDDHVGGLVGGQTWDATVTNCYSVGSVSGSADVGGLLGQNSAELVGISDSVLNSFWDVETSGQTTSAGGTGKATAEMQTAGTFLHAGWDFIDEIGNGTDEIWVISEGQGYPRLNLMEMPVEPVLTSAYGGGSGTPDDPYLIYTAEQLNTIGLIVRDWDSHFKLMADIDLSDHTGTDFNIIGVDMDNTFTGSFDGNGHTISNFRYTSVDRHYIGIFGCIGLQHNGAEIRDLGVLDSVVDAGNGSCIAVLVGQMRDGTVTNCYCEGGSVSGGNKVGGLVGGNGGTIANCYAVCDVSRFGTNWYGGGGGLVGFNSTIIKNCYAGGSVTGNLTVGGLVGMNSGHVINCYSTASVSGTEGVGGLLGMAWGGRVVESFWDVETSGQATCDEGMGITTAEMMTRSTFLNAGWDFMGEALRGTKDIWAICEGTNYPRFAWQIEPADFVCPDGITVDDYWFFLEYWLEENCGSSNDWCQGTDVDRSGTVDELDLELLFGDWLAEQWANSTSQ